jgi:hypothetical protein
MRSNVGNEGVPRSGRKFENGAFGIPGVAEADRTGTEGHFDATAELALRAPAPYRRRRVVVEQRRLRKGS